MRSDANNRKAAQRALSEAERVLTDETVDARLPTLGWDRPLTPLLMPLYGAFVEPSGAEYALLTVDTASVPGSLPLNMRSDEARILARMLRKHVSHVLYVATDGSAFCFDDAPIF